MESPYKVEESLKIVGQIACKYFVDMVVKLQFVYTFIEYPPYTFQTIVPDTCQFKI